MIPLLGWVLNVDEMGWDVVKRGVLILAVSIDLERLGIVLGCIEQNI